MVRTAIQLYSVHDIGDDVATVLEHVAETDLDGVEFFEYDDPDAIAAALDETGLDVAGAHVGIDAFDEDFEGTLDAWTSMGVETFVVPWAEPEVFESRASVEELAERLEALAERLAERGYDLHYHNHDQEFVDLDGEYAYEVLAAEAPNVGLELDLGWAGAAGADPLELAEAYADRIEMLHVKDYDPETGGPAKVGEGGLDLDAVAEAAAENGVEWLIYEYEEGTDTYETVEHAGEVMPPLKR